MALTFSLYEGIGGTFNYMRNGGFRVIGLGHLRHNIPVYSITMLLSVTAFVVAVVCASALLARRHLPRFATATIARTPLGVYQP